MSRPKRYQTVFAELKRRKVFRVAALYGAVAFVVLQAADLMVEGLQLPQAILTIVTLLTLLGFPIAVVMAWAFDVTPAGVKRTDPAASGELEAIVAQPAARRWPAGLVALAGIFMLVGGVWWTAVRGVGVAADGPAAAGPASASVAVLPFVNMSGDEENEYFSDGITEELLNALSRVPELKVAARTSAFAFKNSELDVREIAQRLGVATVLEGSVRKSGNRVRITAQLIDAEDGYHLWSNSYDRELTDIFAIQDEIARSIVEALPATLQAPVSGSLSTAATANVQAYNEYLRGRHYWNQRSLAAFDSAIQYYNRAVLLDPTYARAYAGLAETYVLLSEYGGPSIPEVAPFARAATERALALDPDLAEAYVASGYRKLVFEHDPSGAERDYLKAIELKPDYATAHQWYAELLIVTRRWEEALAEIERAVELDPLAPAPNMILCMSLSLNGRSDEAIAVIERTLDRFPKLLLAAWIRAITLVTKGDLVAAGPAFDRMAELSGTDPAVYGAYLAALEDPAKKPAAIAALERSDVFGTAGNAEYLAELGAVDETLAALERAYEAYDPFLHWVNALAQYEGLRSDPRFRAFLRKLNLE